MKLIKPILVFLLATGYWLLASPAHAATSLELTTPKSSLPINKAFDVVINITSDDNTLGTDVVLNYDPQILRLDSVAPGTLYPNYSKVNGQTTTGTVNISAVSDFTSGITPNGTYATLIFTPLKGGTTDISLAFDPSNTALTGVIPFEGDSPSVLSQAPTPLSLTITAASLLNQVPSGTWRLPVTMAVIVALIIIVFFLMRRKPPVTA